MSVLMGVKMRKYKNVTTTEIGHSLYNIWKNMKCRCYDSNCKRYSDYGGRGIVICNDWLEDFDCFADWALKQGYSLGLTIERIDVNGNYEPSNCKWITKSEQALNTRQNLLVEYRGEIKPLIVWCNKLNLSYDATHNRIQKGWSVEKAFTEPLFDSNKSFAAACRAKGINPGTVKSRMEKFGWDFETAVNTPCEGRGTMYNAFGNKPPRKCLVCGCEYIPNNGKQKYCSEKCHSASKRKMFREILSE